jgi:hypothetical protein
MLGISTLHTPMQAVRHLEARRRQFASEASEAQMKQMLQSLRRQQQVALERHEQWLSAENVKLKERMQFMVLISAFVYKLDIVEYHAELLSNCLSCPKGPRSMVCKKSLTASHTRLQYSCRQIDTKW